ncbi:NACHT, LRR and PYD domains-containing 14-like, partial [Paramuricea clavata]
MAYLTIIIGLEIEKPGMPKMFHLHDQKMIRIVVALKEAEIGKFTCYVAPESTLIYKTQVDKACYSRYQQNYNSPLPFYWFVILSIWFPIIVAVIYSLCVRRRVEEIDPSHESQTQEEVENQYAVFHPSGFDFEFSCSLPPTGFTSKIAKNGSASQSNSTSIACENATASDKNISWVIVTVFNASFALIMFLEMIRLCRRFPKCKYTVGWGCDADFITIYLLRKRYTRVEIQVTDLQAREVLEPCRAIDGVDLEFSNLQECIDFYKGQVLEPSRTTDVISGPKTGLDDLYIDVVIHTERAPHKFSKDMERHEMFDVYMKVPQHSIRLKKVKDLFYPNKDTTGKSPRKILAVGRPGIGKTVLTEKIMRDWANGVDEFYRRKIVFYFKFRWFDSNELKDITLKTFLRHGTRLSDENFENIYKYVTKHPEQAILIFDGLDEFNGKVDCLQHLPPPDDPNICMSGIDLLIKLISGYLLKGATLLMTSRPTANDFYSRLTFDRTVEILGFTSDKIETYVSQFCDNNNRSDLKEQIWNHIKSSSDLLNLCYIPVNCLIVSTILFECVSDPRNDNGAVPTTMTELYQLAITYFDKHHNRKLSRHSSEEAIKKLQLLAYDGIEPRQLVFDEESFDEEMKNSGLLNSLSSPIRTQFCFIHLTIQEFLAARHVTETFTPEKIKEFILSHIESGKWHLVLQFIAGLLGKKNGYKDSVLAFAESFVCKDGILDVTDNSVVIVIKCLREADDEYIAKQACETTAMSDVVSLSRMGRSTLTSSDWAAVTFVCKLMKKLTKLDFGTWTEPLSEHCYLEINKLLQQRCIKELNLSGLLDADIEEGDVFKALMESNCSLKHEHVKLTQLKIACFRVTDNESSSKMCEFFKNGHASSLEKLILQRCEIWSGGVSILCEILDNKLCPELTCLDLSGNSILDEGVAVLCNALIEQNLFKLAELFLGNCSLTDECIPSLCELLRDKRCNLTVLELYGNKGISDEGLRMLCQSALTTEHCKLVELNMYSCSLTDDCEPELLKALQDEHCKLTELGLDDCSLTDKCIPEVCKALQDERCRLTVLSLEGNKGISDKGLRMLCRSALTMEHCKLKKLRLPYCSLTDECIPDLRKVLQDEHCVLNELRLDGNKFTEEGKKSLREIETHEHVK